MRRIVFFLLLIGLFYACQTPTDQTFENTCWEGEGVILVLMKDHVAFLRAPSGTLFDEDFYEEDIDEVGEWEYVEESFQKQIHFQGHPAGYHFEVETSLFSQKPKYLYYFEGDPDEYNIHKLYPVSCGEVK